MNLTRFEFRPIWFAFFFAVIAVDLNAQTSDRSILQYHESKPTSSNDQADSDKPVTEPMNGGKTIDRLMTQLVLDNIPHTYTDDKDWGNQSERWDGIELRREGFNIKTKRRKKKVNHGTWKKYSATLVNPENEFEVQLKNMHSTKDEERMAFDLHFAAHLDLEARQSKWVKGVQLYSISADGHAKVRVTISMELGALPDFNKLPPDLVLKPLATNAEIVVDEFRIDHVSKLGGEFAQQISRGVRKVLEEKIVEKEAKIVEKINRQLDKKKDRLRFSFTEAFDEKWSKLTQPLLEKIEPAKESQRD